MSESEKVDTTSFAVFGTIMSVLTLGALVGNIICFKMTRRLIKNKPSMALVLNLCMSDIIVASVSWTAFMLQHIAAQLHYEISVIVHKLFWSTLVGLGNATLLTLTGLAADCFIALRWPLHYKDIATSRTVNIYISVLWVSSVLTGGGDFLAALARTTAEYPYSEAIRESIVLTGRKLTPMGMLTASITMLISNSLSFICLLVMIPMYGYILAKIRRVNPSRTISKRERYKSEIQAVRTTLMIFASFLLLWLPTLIVNIMSVVKPDFLSKLTFTQASFIGYTADCLLMVHSMVDALIYGLRVKNTISRQRRNRENQADFSRANTLRRNNNSSDSDKLPNSFYEDKSKESTSMAYNDTVVTTTDVYIHEPGSPPANSTLRQLAISTVEADVSKTFANGACNGSYTTAIRDNDDHENTNNGTSIAKNIQLPASDNGRRNDNLATNSAQTKPDIPLIDSIQILLQLANGIHNHDELASDIQETDNKSADDIPVNNKLANSTDSHMQLTNGIHVHSQCNSRHSTPETNRTNQSLQVPNGTRPMRSSLKKTKSSEGQTDKEVRFHLSDKDGESQTELCSSKSTKAADVSTSNSEKKKLVKTETVSSVHLQPNGSVGVTNGDKPCQVNSESSLAFDNTGFDKNELKVNSCSNSDCMGIALELVGQREDNSVTTRHFSCETSSSHNSVIQCTKL